MLRPLIVHDLAMTPAPVISPVELRPRRIWFFIAALIPVGGAVAAVGVLLFVFLSEGDLGQPLTLGQPVTVQLSDEKMVWFRTADGRPPDVECAASPKDGGKMVEFGQTKVLVAGAKVDDGQWRGLLTLHARPAGRYEVICTAAGAGPQPALSIGDPPRFYGPQDTAMGSLAALGVTSTGVVAGLVLAVVVAVRRGMHRARLHPQPTAAQGG
ncbi:hypothetical protein [Micromonospora sp. DT41]|uniref:hypothetical protein n=1 Tax=Micromonospora sp. DT41 TaxID=3393437 RepID=UPI003CEF9C18